MLKVLIIFFSSLSILYAKVDVSITSLHQNNIYNIESEDTLFSGDAIKFYFESDRDEEIKLFYLANGKREEIYSAYVKQGKKSIFPLGNDRLVLDERVGLEEFILESKKETKKISFNHISQFSNIDIKDSKEITYKNELSRFLNIVNFKQKSNSFKKLSNRKFNDLSQVVSNTRGKTEIKVYKTLLNSTVLIKSNNEIGTGIVVSKDAQILTNWHVIKEQNKIYVAFKPKRGNNPAKNNYYLAKVLKINIVKDLALLQLVEPNTKEDIKPIIFSKMDNIEVGQDAYTVGHPLGELWTFSKGLVSQIRDDYEWVTNNIKHNSKYIIQTQTSTSRGNSGGPLVDENTKLLGINTLSKQGGQNLNYAISIKDIKEFLESKNEIAIKQINKSKNKNKKLNIVKVMQVYDKNNNLMQLAKLDANTNGTIDGTLIDTNSNGKWNRYYDDKNENNVHEQLSFDKNENGTIELIYYDKNEDGKWDLIAYDKDEDGIIEKETNY